MFANRNDGSYYCYTGHDMIGVVRRIAKGRWIAVGNGYPPDASEFGTRREAAAWLRVQAR